MPDVLHLKPQEIDTAEKRGKYTVSVIGCGQNGVLYGVAFAEAGFKVVCSDADQSLVRSLARGRAPLSERAVESKLRSFTRTGVLSVTDDLKSTVARSDIIIITTAVKIDDKKNSDYSEAENVCKQVGAALRRGVLVVYGSIAGVGFMEGVVKETLENTSGLKAGEDFALAYSPNQVPEEKNSAESAGKTELRFAASDLISLETVSAVLATIDRKGVRQVLDFKTAELATLFAINRRDVNVALTNEFAVLCENAGIDYFETRKLLDPELRESSFNPTIAEEAKDEAYFLLENAENLNLKLKLPEAARQINEDMVRHAANLTQDALRSCGRTLRRARITVLGVTGPRTAGYAFSKMLEAKGAKISVYDPFFAKNEPIDTSSPLKRSISEAVEGSDCIVILTGQEQFKRLNLKKLHAMMRAPAAIVDLAGILEPRKVEEESFAYRGLGRGVGKK
jgi:nucleotide sugar dehydrogenase